jgi:protease-4
MADFTRFQEGMRRLFWPITAPLKFIQEHFKAVLLVLLLLVLFFPSDEHGLLPNNLQHIALKGPIMDVTEILAQIEAADKNDAVKGVLFEINSPGGAVPPSLELSYAIKRLKEKKPVVVYASGAMASGGYYAAIWADRIFANPGSLIGSIGVIMQGTDLSGLMEKVGIKSQVVSAGRYKQIGTPDREWTPEERRELNKVIQGTYDLFVGDVAAARNLDPKKHALYADAHIFTARQAREVGLVDAVGVMYDAKQEVVRLSGVEKPVWNEEDYFEKFFKSLAMDGALLLHTYFPAVSLR